MKRLIVFFCVAMMCASCKPWGGKNLSMAWYVANVTEQTLILKCPYTASLLSDDYEYREFKIAPMSEVIVCSGKNLRVEDIPIDSYFKRSAEVLGEVAICQILSEDGAVLKIWKYPNIDLSNRSFFDQTKWNQEGGASCPRERIIRLELCPKTSSQQNNYITNQFQTF